MTPSYAVYWLRSRLLPTLLALLTLPKLIWDFFQNPFGFSDEESLADLREALTDPRYSRFIPMEQADQIIAAGDARAARRLLRDVYARAHPEALQFGDRSFTF